VDGLDADPTGATLSDDALNSLHDGMGEVVVTVPLGEYRFSATTHRITGPSSLTFVAPESGVPPPEIDQDIARPRFVAPEGYDGLWLDIDIEGELAIEGLDIDRREFETGPQIRVRTPSNTTSRITDLRVLDRDDSDTATGAIFDLACGGGATIDVTRLTMPHGAWWSRGRLSRRTDTAPPETGRVGLRVGPENDGTIRLRNCAVSENSGHAVDALGSNGPLHVTQGRYHENNGYGIRCGHPDDSIEDAVVRGDLRGVRVPVNDSAGRRIDGIDPEAYSMLGGIAIDHPGIEPGNPTSGGTLTGVGVEMRSADGERDDQTTPETIVEPALEVTGAGGGPTLERVDARMDLNGVPALAARPPTRGDPDAPENGLTLRSVIARGDAQSGTAVVIANRPTTTIRGRCIERPAGRVPFDLPDGVVPKRTKLARRCPRRT
jgi:hypothetical protein